MTELQEIINNNDMINMSKKDKELYYIKNRSLEAWSNIILNNKLKKIE
jgi:hypothetical protein